MLRQPIKHRKTDDYLRATNNASCGGKKTIVYFTIRQRIEICPDDKRASTAEGNEICGA
jgi:hypothetical protein